MKTRFLMLGLAMLLSQPSLAASKKMNPGDPADIRTPAGQAFHAAKRSGATCPFASKGHRENSMAVAAAAPGGTVNSLRSSSKRIAQ